MSFKKKQRLYSKAGSIVSSLHFTMETSDHQKCSPSMNSAASSIHSTWMCPPGSLSQASLFCGQGPLPNLPASSMGLNVFYSRICQHVLSFSLNIGTTSSIRFSLFTAGNRTLYNALTMKLSHKCKICCTILRIFVTSLPMLPTRLVASAALPTIFHHLPLLHL